MAKSTRQPAGTKKKKPVRTSKPAPRRTPKPAPRGTPAQRPSSSAANARKAKPAPGRTPKAPKSPPKALKKKTPPKPLVKPSKKSITKNAAPKAFPAKATKTAKPSAKPSRAPAPAKKPAPKVASPKADPKPAQNKSPAPKPAPKTAAPGTKNTAKGTQAPAPAPSPKTGALKGKDAVRARILAQRAKPAKPAAFSLDEVLAIAKTVEKTAPAPAPGALIATKSGKTAPLPAHALQPAKPTTVRAASLADILGFNPKAKASHAANEEDAIPDKFKRYYKLLIELRNHVTGQVDQHSEETLKRSAKEDSGDLSSYGTDGGTDSFDRDFALSLVANEQEALAEIEAAIQRIKAGTYGVCEHTQQNINKERLIAVPFTRYTAAAMKEIEKTRYKVRGQTGILGEGEEGGPKVEDDSGE
jgi:RNA polymerase-binding transcription factor DksA